jgi:hypothetical protein
MRKALCLAQKMGKGVGRSAVLQRAVPQQQKQFAQISVSL